jgi:DNA primase
MAFFPDEPIILVEGMLDRVWMWQNGWKNVLGAMTARFYKGQRDLLLNLDNKTRTVITFFDNDVAGRNATVTAINLLSKHFPKLYCVSNYYGYKDPHEMSPKILKKAIESRTSYIEFILKGGIAGKQKLVVPPV